MPRSIRLLSSGLRAIKFCLRNPSASRSSDSFARSLSGKIVPRHVKWDSLPPNERTAWEALGWHEESWRGDRQSPVSMLCTFNELNPAQQAAARHGLGFSDSEWNEMLTAEDGLVASDDSSSGGGGGGGLVSTLAKAALSAVKIGAPAVGSALSRSRHPATMVAGHVLENMPSIIEQWSEPVVVHGIETTLYLDDSGSMNWHSGRRTTPLDEGRKVIHSVSPLLQGPTRILKFGSSPTTLAPREEHAVSASLVSGLNWSGSSGGTYMWHMIEQDVLSRCEHRPLKLTPKQWPLASSSTYTPLLKRLSHSSLRDHLLTFPSFSCSPRPQCASRPLPLVLRAVITDRPGTGKLRLIVLTDGHDTQSPAEYNGRDGMNPMMRTLHDHGYDVEWHIVVLGDVADTGGYAALAGATGGSYLAIDEFDEGSAEAASFLRALDTSSSSDDESHEARRRRQRRYIENDRAERVSWLKALPPPSGGRGR